MAAQPRSHPCAVAQPWGVQGWAAGCLSHRLAGRDPQRGERPKSPSSFIHTRSSLALGLT